MPKRRGSLAQKRQRVRYVFIALGVLVLIGLVVLLWFGVRRHEVTITSVDVSGTQFIDAREVESLTQETLEGNYFWFVPKRNALFYPKGEIERRLTETFFPINILSIDRDGLKGLLISIEERQMIAEWCSTSTTTPCYLVDKTGLLFEEANKNSGTLVYQSEPLELGTTFLDGEFFELHNFITTLRTVTNRAAETILVDQHGDVFVFFREGGELRFVRTHDKEALLDNIISTFSSKRFQTDEILEYVDFRFGNKVYVRFLDE